MKRKFLSAALSVAMLASAFPIMTAPPAALAAEDLSWTANTSGKPQYHKTQRQMEEIDRGLIASYVTADNHVWSQNGVYLSWRLFGTESLENQAFDIYRNGTKIHTTNAHDATCYFDKAGTKTSQYIVVKAGDSIAQEKAVTPTQNYTAKGSEVSNGNSHPNSFTYIDIPIVRPDDVARMGDGKISHYYSPDKDHEGGANDGSVGDLDGDGEYEIVLKWDPTDSKDSAGADFTGNVYIDAYEIDPNSTGYKWRIDLGQNVTAGAHYTQFIVYDLNGDGKAEVAMKTAPGSIDGTGHYVSEAGDTDEIRNVDNEAQFIGTSGRLKGKNPFTQYLTIFDGETGAALYTTDFIPYEGQGNWGDDGAKYNRSERYLAGVAYLDGVHPSLIMCRGYYHNAVIRAYDWDGEELSMRWEHNASSRKDDNMFGQGNHNLSIADVDNDGFDEIVYGSATLDHDGTKTVFNTKLGHGDAMHVNDFNNDGYQEVFSVKEDSEGWKKYAEDLRSDVLKKHFWESGKISWESGKHDNGRGVMDNIDDDYALKNDNAMAISWSSGFANAHDMNGNDLKAKPANAGSGTFDNFLVYWDGDLGRELLDANIIQKYDAENGWTKRFYGPSDGYTLTGGTTSNYSKRNPVLVADLWGDWREEVIMATGKGQNDTPKLRIFTSTIPTEYRLTTLMHDSQYRCSVAWQNVAYNQPTHTSYYVGSRALAKDGNTTLNYLAPATLFTNVAYELDKVAVTGITLSQNSMRLEKSHTLQLAANIEPTDATKKTVTWTSSDESVATVSAGTVTAVNPGKATITATTRDGGFTATCEVEVWSNPVTEVSISADSLNVGTNCSKKLIASVLPADASVQGITWHSSNPMIATVDSDGNVYGVKTGAALISAISQDNGMKAECVVNVVPLSSTDKVGDNAFVPAGNSTDTLKYEKITATSANITHCKSESGGLGYAGGEVYKTFEKVENGHGHLNFRFTTGGQKDDSGNWKWDGREYNLTVQILGEDDNNLITLTQPYEAGGAAALISKIGAQSETNFTSDWNAVVDGVGNIQGSAKRWIVDVDFDYDNDTAIATITGTDGTWAAVNGQYKAEFKLDGLHLAKLRYFTTPVNNGAIIATPQLSNLVYEQQDVTYGATSELYSKGAMWFAPFEQADTTDWTVTDGVTLKHDAAVGNGRIYFNEKNPKAPYSASKTFNIDSNAILTYDADWYFGNATGRLVNREYIQFGNKLRLGWSNSNEGGYSVLASSDGGATYNGVTTAEDGTVTVDDSKKLFTGSNAQFTKHVQVIYDVANKTIKSLTFDGKTISDYTNYKLGDDAVMDSVSFGFERGGSANDWEYFCGLDSLVVSQFVKDADPVRPTEAPTPSPSPKPTPKPTATPKPSPSPTPTPTPKPIEHAVTSFIADGRCTVSDAVGEENEITISNASNANNARAYAYADISEYIKGQDSYAVEFDSYLTSSSRAKIELADLSQRPGNTNRDNYDTAGVAFNVGVTSSSDYCANGDKTIGNAAGARDAWVHIVINVDTVNKKISYRVSDVADATLLSGTGVAYLNTTTDPTGIALVDWINSAEAKFKNIKVLTYGTEEEETAKPTETVPPETEQPTETIPPETEQPTGTPTPTPDIDGLEIGTPALDGENVTLNVTNKGSEDQPIRLIIASYDEHGSLVSVKLSEESSVAANGSVTLTAAKPTTDSFKIMLWNTESAMFPFMNSVTALDTLAAAEEEPTEADDAMEEATAVAEPDEVEEITEAPVTTEE